MLPRFRLKPCVGALLGALALPGMAQITPTPMAISDVPWYLVVGTSPNVLLIMDNSNSMDEAPSGEAVGSAHPDSKSEITRGVARNIIDTFGSSMNIGLMAYQQNTTSLYYLSNSPYDVSFDPANYDPAFTGSRASDTKRFRILNPWNTSNYIYYNVMLPMYSSAAPSASPNDKTVWYSPASNVTPTATRPDGFWPDAVASSDTGPWAVYYRMNNGKTDTSDNPPSSPASQRVTYNRFSSSGVSYSCSPTSGFSACSFFFPTDSDVAQGITDFGTWLVDIYVGRAWYAMGAPGLGYLHVPIAPVDTAQKTKLLNKLATSQFVTNGPTTATLPLQNAGETPIAGTLKTAHDYFNGNTTYFGTNQGRTAGLPALPTSCNNFTVLLSDGLPSTTVTGAATTPAAGLTEAADSAAALFSSSAKVKTYMIGFALPYGVDPAQLDTIAEAGGTGRAYSADDTASLNQVMSGIFTDILTTSAGGSAVGYSSTTNSPDTVIYQTVFDSTDWQGHLRAIPLQGSSPTWDAASALPAFPTRKNHIATYHPEQKNGVLFQWSSLDATQQTALGSAAILNYIAGDSSNEGITTGQYRPRASKLGDIINSEPVHVGKPKMNYRDSIENGSAYSSFVSANATRTPMVYVGANDGMLHGFDAATGEEKFAYVPSAVFPNLSLLAGQNYSHHYYVDGTPVIVDAYVKTPLTSSKAWRTILAGGLNAGGQGIYALDVTTPSVSSVQNRVMWEFGDRQTSTTSTTVNFDKDMGYSFSMPSIVKTRAGWVAIFGNGYNNYADDGSRSDTGNAVLYVVNLETGELLKKLDTNSGFDAAGKPNGLSTPAVVDINGDSVADYVYAGDLKGQLWKFDLTSASAASWSVAYSGTPLYTARTSGGQVQSITAQPEVGRHPNGGYMVYFGTGKSIEISDNTDATTQTFYGIRDNGAAVTGGRSTLAGQTVLTVQNANGSKWRIISDEQPDWTVDKGWYLDLPEQYERVITAAQLDGGRIVFTTAIPPVATVSDPCGNTGSGWLMELDSVTGGRLPETPFDVNGDNAFDAQDYLAWNGGNVPVGGLNIDGVPSRAVIFHGDSSADPDEEDPPADKKCINTTSGLVCVDENPMSDGTQDRAWRDVSQIR